MPSRRWPRTDVVGDSPTCVSDFRGNSAAMTRL
jgi:hypothetical protein